MTSKTFTSGTVIDSAWLNDVDAKTYEDTVNVKLYGAIGDGVTDDSTAVQNAINSVVKLGGYVYFPPGQYLFNSQVTIDRTYAAFGSNFVGERNLILSGYGAEIRTNGAISAFNIKGGWAPNKNCTLEGFTIYHRSNTTAIAGIRMIGAGLVVCKDISVVVSSSLPAGYAAFSLENLVASDPDTGCFWCVLDGCAIRPWSGAEGFCTYGVKAMGAANALTLTNNTFSGANTHVILMAHPGQIYTPNSVNIDGNFFEGPSTAIGINLVGTAVAGVYHVSGTRITNNRFEALNTAITLTGTGSTVQLPAYMSGNYADTSVTTYLSNSLNIPVIVLDFDLVGAGMGPAKLTNQQGVVIQNDDSTFDPLTLIIPNLNKGLAFKTSGGTVIGNFKYSSAAGGNGVQIAGSYAPNYHPLTLVGCQGIAARDTSANNLAGSITFTGGTTATVSFSVAETNTNYLIFLDIPANKSYWVTAKTTSGFTINTTAASTDTVGWLLVKHL